MHFQNRGKETGVVKENLFPQGGIGKGYIFVSKSEVSCHASFLIQ